jgi:hypothetical protein
MREMNGCAWARGVRVVVAILMAAQLSLLPAASPAIGLAVAQGSIQLDRASVSNSGTVFEGSLVETGSMPALVQLSGGQRVQLVEDSRGQVFRDRLTLSGGAARWVSGAAGYPIDALGLRMATDKLEGGGEVRMARSGSVQVTAGRAAVRVNNEKGLLIARVLPGRSLLLTPGAGAPESVAMTGVLHQKMGYFILTDEATGMVVQLQGGDLLRFVGRKIRVSGPIVPGASPKEGAVQVVQAEKIDPAPEGGSGGKKAAGAAAAGAAGGAAAGSGISSTVAVIAGVAVAGAAGGTAAVVASKNSNRDALSKPSDLSQ